MKIGILTFHSQLNYGGVLQCWALQTALTRMGHEVVVIDRWLDPVNECLDGPFGHAGFAGWCVILLKSLLGCRTWSRVLRHWRTKRFVRQCLNITPYHFYNWDDVSRSPDLRSQIKRLDIIVVGSDQVWHGGGGGWYPNPYLLEGAPPCRAIAYAVSFGMNYLPLGVDYAAGFNRFSAISVREMEGLRLVESKGFKATHVVDPTLLLDPVEWSRLGRMEKMSRRIVCYFLSEDPSEAVNVLEPWARQNDYTVEIICENAFKAMPRSPSQLAVRSWEMFEALFRPSRVRVRMTYGPREFIRAFAQAEMCITDSFHAVMFSAIFDCNVRFLRPQNVLRKSMFARISEFEKTSIIGAFVVDDLSAALSSLKRGEKMMFRHDVMQHRRIESTQWLKCSLQAALRCDIHNS